jgi:endonuclease/exonuclease/phosphatase family metal-dependent hydrolase
MRIASFNVENLFERARAMDPADHEAGRPALEAYAEINGLLARTTYGDDDKTRIVELLRKLGLAGKDDGGTFARLRQNRGRLLKRSGGEIDVVAKGRGDWIGWVELKMAPVNQVATQHTARVMRDVDADVLAVVEADNRIALLKFLQILFKRIKAPSPYAHVMLIDGNDDRGIDVALMSKASYEIARIRSHVDDQDGGGRIFSRDCAEYTIRTPGDERVVLLVNHLKSKGYGKQADSDARRERQAVRVAEIYHDLRAAGEDHVAVVGDFNDFPESPPLAPLLGATDLRDISTHDHFDDGGRPGTFGTGTARNKIDYILLSPALFERASGGGIFRKGAWGGKNGDMWEHYPTMKSPVEAASDHSAIYADLQL